MEKSLIKSAAESRIQVSVGVIERDGHVLLSQRQAGQAMAGRWEFPGGKQELGESAIPALQRELREELGIEMIESVPLIQLRYDYPHGNVLLNVFRVTKFDGEATGCEGQVLQWVPVESLENYHFPEANEYIVKALRLPEKLLISLPSYAKAWEDHFEKMLAQDSALIQVGLEDCGKKDFTAIAKDAIARAHAAGKQCVLNCAPDQAISLGADGVHIAGERLFHFKTRPVPKKLWFAAFTHNLDEIRQAEKLGCDFITLSPINATQCHPEAEPRGWPFFESMVKQTNLPVYALGGVRFEDMPKIRAAFGQGVASMRAWDKALA